MPMKTLSCSATRYACRAAFGALLGAVLAFPACSKGPEPTIQTFESGDEGWVPYGRNARLEVVRDAAEVKNGKAALALRYTYQQNEFASAILPLEAGEIGQLTHMRFWIRSDQSTAVAVVFSEKQPGGGYYSTWFWCPAKTWQHVDLTPDDFSPVRGPTYPVDADARLDVDQVIAIGVSDLGQAFQGLGTGASYPLVTALHPGAQTLLLDDVELVAGPEVKAAKSPALPIARQDRGFATWVTLGGAQLEAVQAPNPIGAIALRATYNRPDGKYVLISHALPKSLPAGTHEISLRAAAKRDSTLLVYLEEALERSVQGPRYRAIVSVPGNSGPKDIRLLLTAFEFDNTGPADPDGHLDPNEVRSISLIDVTNASTHELQDNVLWVSEVQTR
jgi:hypothetical protein